MGLLDLFSGWKERRGNRALNRAMQYLLDPRISAQNLPRYEAIGQLAADRSAEGTVALMRRFGYNHSNTILDADEKRAVRQAVEEQGAEARDALVEYIRREKRFDEAYAYDVAVQLLRRVCDDEFVLDLLASEIAGIEDRFSASRERINELLAELSRFKGPRVLETFRALLLDEDDEVRIKAVDFLASHGDEAAGRMLTERLLDEEETVRIKRHIADRISASGLRLKEDVAGIVAKCLEWLACPDRDRRVTALDVLGLVDGEDAAWGIVSTFLESDDDDLRRSALRTLVDKGISVRRWRSKLVEALPRGYQVGKDGFIEAAS